MLPEPDQRDDGGCQIHDEKILVHEVEQGAQGQRADTDAEIAAHRRKQDPVTPGGVK